MCCVPVLYLSLTTAERYPSGCLYLSLRNPNVSSIDFFPPRALSKFYIMLYYLLYLFSALYHVSLMLSKFEILYNLVVWNSNLKVYEPNTERLNFLLKSVTIYRKQRFSSIEEIVGVFSGILTTIKHLILWATYLII